MHDLRVLREQIDLLRDGMRRRGMLDDARADDRPRTWTLERERRTLIQAAEERKARAQRQRAGSCNSASAPKKTPTS